jgi:hypothetical protein
VGCRVLVLIQRQIDAHALKFATSVQCSREAFQLVPTMFAPRDATLNLTLGLVGCFCLRLLTSVLLLVSVAQTQSTSRSPPNSPESDATALAKETQNPVGDVASIPFQFNFSNGGDLKDDTFLNLNFQPVVPLHVSSGLTLITRTIVPIVSFPAPGRTRLSGIGDIQEQLFFTAAHPRSHHLGHRPRIFVSHRNYLSGQDRDLGRGWVVRGSHYAGSVCHRGPRSAVLSID